MILGITGLILIAIALLIAVASTRPSEYRVVRSATIAAPAAIVFDHVNNLQKWEAWSPWAKLDPDAKITFEGPVSGKGATMRWSGNNKIGEGSLIVTDSRPPEMMDYRLEFLRPFKGVSSAEFIFKEEAGQTAVQWSMSGKNNLMGKIMSLFMNCDKMIGGQFEKGLSQLRAVSEAAKAA